MNHSSAPLLSIITPTFNSERFIDSCIQGVIDQNVTDIEHIVMDGLSTDKTASIARDYSEKHPHLKVFSEKDSGQSNAMNKGIDKATGKFICFLNVDDFFEPNILSWVIGELGSLSDRHLLVGNCNIVNLDRELMRIRKPSRCSFPDILRIWRTDVFPANPSSYFYARHLHSLAGPYDENEHYVLDYEMMIRLLQVAEVKYVNRTLGNFVLHEDTKTHQNSSGGGRITKLAVYQRYIKQAPLLQRIPIQLQFFYHMRLMRSNNPLVFFALRPKHAYNWIVQKMSR